MVDSLYEFYRNGAGFCLVVVGIAFLIEPKRLRVRRAFGFLNLAVGILFCLSSLDHTMKLPLDVGNALISNLIFMLSQSSYDMVLFVFGGQRQRGLAHKVFWAGFFWAQIIWLLPLLDGIMALPMIWVSLEDGHSLGPIHLVASFLVYAWPVLVCTLSFRHSRWRLSDLPIHARESHHLVRGLYTAIGIMVFITVALLTDLVWLYRFGQFALLNFMLVWYFLMTRNPQALARVRREIHIIHERKALLDESETRTITERLFALVQEEVYRRPDLNLGQLAQALKMPAYRLSRYFNDYLSTSFPVWLNELRVEWVCQQMIHESDSSLLELAIQAGYGGKTTFNGQFIKVKGLSPSEFRKRLEKPGT